MNQMKSISSINNCPNQLHNKKNYFDFFYSLFPRNFIFYLAFFRNLFKNPSSRHDKLLIFFVCYFWEMDQNMPKQALDFLILLWMWRNFLTCNTPTINKTIEPKLCHKFFFCQDEIRNFSGTICIYLPFFHVRLHQEKSSTLQVKNR